MFIANVADLADIFASLKCLNRPMQGKILDLELLYTLQKSAFRLPQKTHFQEKLSK